MASNALSWDWLPLIAYTAQLGSGLSATLSVEHGLSRRSGIDPAGVGGGYGGQNAPDIVANVRVDQAWGSAQVMGALHEVRSNAALSAAGIESSEWGYALGAGIQIKTPQTGSPNNSFLLQGVYSEGAVEFTGLNASPVTTAAGIGFIKGAFGAASALWDAVPIVATGDLDLTTAWSVYAAYRHYWTPSLRTGFSFGLTDIDYSAAAAAAAGVNDARLYQGHVSTIWSPVSGLDLSLDLVYSKVKTHGDCGGVHCPGTEDIWTAWTRIRRNF